MGPRPLARQNKKLQDAKTEQDDDFHPIKTCQHRIYKSHRRHGTSVYPSTFGQHGRHV
jgi:hypothetical protein